MDRYILLISDNKNFHFNAKTFNEIEQSNNCYSKASFSYSIPKTGSVYACSIHISTKDLDDYEFIKDEIKWLRLYEETRGNSNVTPLLASEIVFFLTDKLSHPGSFMLDIYWCFSDANSDFDHLIPLLGALKKLKLWQKAEITIFDCTSIDETSDFTLLLSQIKAFLGAEVVKMCELLELHRFVLKNNQIFWRGNLLVEERRQSDLIFENFQLLQHCCHKDHEKPFMKCSSTVDGSHLWFRNHIKVVELVDLNTVPMFWYTSSVFILQCPISSFAGIKLEETFRTNKSGGFLCRLAFNHGTIAFSACQELNSFSWKEAFQRNPLDLSPPNLELCHTNSTLLFMVTSVLNKNCSSVQDSENFLHFHAYELQLSPTVDLQLPVEANILAMYESKVDLHNSTSPLPYDCFDYNFFSFFSQILNVLKTKGNPCFSRRELQNLLLESWVIFKHTYHSDLSQIIDENLLNQFFRNRLSPNLKNKCTKAIKGSKKKHSSLCFDSETFVALNAAEIVDHFKGKQYKEYVNTLLQSHTYPEDLPSLSCVTNFNSAIKISHYGVDFNVDAFHSEAKDKYHRKLTEKLIKFETLSIGSKMHVPSVTAKNFGDSPIKTNKALHTKPMHTPRKKKKIAKVAEKLYKLKAAKGRKIRSSNPPVTPSKKKSNSAKRHAVHFSPSVHKMALRSTPTKSRRTILEKVKLTPRSKAAAKKKIQKKYVRNNKKRLRDIIVEELSTNGITMDHCDFERSIKKLYRVSMAFLKDLKTSEDLENIMQRIVKENVRLVLSLGSKIKQ